MYSNPVTTTESGVILTTCTPDSEASITAVRYLATLESDYRVGVSLSVSRETRGGYSNTRVLDTYEVRWMSGGKRFAVKGIASKAEAMAVAAEKWAKLVEIMVARAAREYDEDETWVDCADELVGAAVLSLVHSAMTTVA